jgi:hypothetical protein
MTKQTLTYRLQQFDAAWAVAVVVGAFRHYGVSAIRAQSVRVSVAGAKDTEIPILAVTKSGKRFAISLSGPLTVDHPAEASIRELRGKTSDIQFIIVNELLVRGNLPAATREVRQLMSA